MGIADIEQNSELKISIVNKNNQIIEYVFDCIYINKNEKYTKLLAEIDMSVEDIEPCLIPSVFEKLYKFSYNEKKDKEYLDLVENHNKQISKQTSKEQKKEFKKEETKKLEELRIKGRLRKLASEISDITNDLGKYPYFCSKLSKNQQGNLFCYSLKTIMYYDDQYQFAQFGIGKKAKLSHNKYSSSLKTLINSANLGNNKAQYDLSKRYMTGNGTVKDPFLAFRFLILSAFNKNIDAQIDLATIYSDTSSQLAQYFSNSNIVIDRQKKWLVFPSASIENELYATYWFKQAAENGHGKSHFELAKRYELGLGTEKNSVLAKQYYEKAYYTYGILDAKEKVEK